MHRKEVVALLRKRLPHLARALTTQLHPSLRVRPSRGTARIGASKIGGAPDLPEGSAWPIRFATVVERDGGRRFRYEDYEWTRRRTLVSEAKDLTLLFQAASGARECWSGSGVVYFWIRRADLERRRFDRAFARLQST